MPATVLPPSATRSAPAAFAGGAVIGALGGLIGLGGAEFRLPLLIGAFRFAALQAVILNKAMSLVVVASALPFRAATVLARMAVEESRLHSKVKVHDLILLAMQEFGDRRGLSVTFRAKPKPVKGRGAG
jgi:hypothetical protein